MSSRHSGMTKVPPTESHRIRSLEGSKCGPSHLAALSLVGRSRSYPGIMKTIQNFSRLSRTPSPDCPGNVSPILTARRDNGRNRGANRQAQDGARRRPQARPDARTRQGDHSRKGPRKTVAANLATASKNVRVHIRPTLDALESERRQRVRVARQPVSSGLRPRAVSHRL
jgi:hypothetical protein